MTNRCARVKSNFTVPVAIAAASFVSFSAGAARAATRIVCTGEQNTQSGENGCEATPCMNGHWLHYPELLGVMLGSGYTVQNDGDGGAVLGCDAATMAAAGGASYCASGKYTMSINPLPDIVIIGPFGEHDQELVAGANGKAGNIALYDEATFQGAYDGMVTKYMALSSHPKIYMMTPIDVLPWGGGADAFTDGKDLVKDIMLQAATAVAAKYNLPLIDTYTAITPGGVLNTKYGPENDGQVTSAGQQAMAQVILDALQSDGGSSTSPEQDAAADTGVSSTSGSTSGSSTSGMAASGAATTGSGSGASGTATSGAVTSGSVTGSGSVTSGTTSTSGTSAGESGAPSNTSGSVGSASGSASGATSSSGGGENAAPKSSSGCSLRAGDSASQGASFALLALGIIGLARRRRS